MAPKERTRRDASHAGNNVLVGCCGQNAASIQSNFVARSCVKWVNCGDHGLNLPARLGRGERASAPRSEVVGSGDPAPRLSRCSWPQPESASAMWSNRPTLRSTLRTWLRYWRLRFRHRRPAVPGQRLCPSAALFDLRQSSLKCLARSEYRDSAEKMP